MFDTWQSGLISRSGSAPRSPIPVGSDARIHLCQAQRPLSARSRHRANTDADRRSTQLDPLDFAFGDDLGFSIPMLIGCLIGGGNRMG